MMDAIFVTCCTLLFLWLFRGLGGFRNPPSDLGDADNDDQRWWDDNLR